MLKYFVGLFFIVNLFSCKEETDRAYLIAGNSKKYWDIVKKSGLFDKEKSYVFPFYCYEFSRNKKVVLYKYKNGKRVEYDYGDVFYDLKWKLIGGDTIFFKFKKYKIIKFNSDSLYFMNKTDTVFLVKSNFPS